MKNKDSVQISTIDIKSLVDYLKEKDLKINELEYVNRGIVKNHKVIHDILVQNQERPIKYVLDTLLHLLEEF